MADYDDEIRWSSSSWRYTFRECVAANGPESFLGRTSRSDHTRQHDRCIQCFCDLGGHNMEAAASASCRQGGDASDMMNESNNHKFWNESNSHKFCKKADDRCSESRCCANPFFTCMHIVTCQINCVLTAANDASAVVKNVVRAPVSGSDTASCQHLGSCSSTLMTKTVMNVRTRRNLLHGIPAFLSHIPTSATAPSSNTLTPSLISPSFA